MLMQIGTWNTQTRVILNDKLIEGISYKQGASLMLLIVELAQKKYRTSIGMDIKKDWRHPGLGAPNSIELLPTDLKNLWN